MSWKIVTGGQTGVDRGALDGAMDVNMAWAGYVPKGWLAEDHVVPLKYRRLGGAGNGVLENQSPSYIARTRENIGISDIVLLVVRNVLRPDATPGTLMTLEEADKWHRPWYVSDGSDVAAVRSWMRQAAVGQRVLGRSSATIHLMVAGPRASLWPEGHAVARALVSTLFAKLARADLRQMELPL